jgi:flagellar protein FliO/FliZ
MQISPALVHASLLALAGGLLVPAVAAAADGEQTKLNLGDEEAAGQAAEQVGASGGSIVRTIVGLAVVIGVIYGLTWVLKQVKQSKSAAATGAGLETLATLPLGANHALHLVRAGDEVVLVGAGERGVTPIRTYTEAEAVALGLLAAPATDMALAEPEVFGTETRRGRFIDELRKRTVIK